MSELARSILHAGTAELPLQALAECCPRSPARIAGPEPHIAPEVPVQEVKTEC